MKTLGINRRQFLRSAVTAGALIAAERSLPSFVHGRSTGSSQTLPYSLVQESRRRFAPVTVARNRVIRTVVGLRPYRDEGFVVGAERFGSKLLVHNYGHGGAGVTLSWGTSSLAVDIARDYVQGTNAPEPGGRRGPASKRAQSFGVLGCGVIGLSTARLLQQRLQGQGVTVTIYAMDLPPKTTSNIAGALWYPSSIYDPQVASATFLQQFRTASLISNRTFQELVSVEYGVRWTDTYELLGHEASLDQELPGGAQLYPQTQVHRDAEHYFGYSHARQFSTMMIEPQVYLRALMRDFYIAGGKIVIKEFKSRDELARLPEQILFNCTGLGARALFGDQKLQPVRGQLEVLLPQPEVDYCILAGRGYMFPRRDGIILGGTFDHNDWSLEPNAEQSTRILAGHAEMMKKLKS